METQAILIGSIILVIFLVWGTLKFMSYLFSTINKSKEEAKKK